MTLVTRRDDWTVDEANAALPRLTEVIERVRAELEGARDHLRATGASASGNGHSQERPAALRFAEAAAALAAEGIVLRDPEQGLVDFPARAPGGRPYFLCWVVGEGAVGWWHWVEDGFAGRTPLSSPPT